jgi:hypothetical protein
MSKHFFSIIIFSLLSSSIFSQNLLTPAENIFDKKFIANSKYEMACFAFSGQKMVEVSSFTVEVTTNVKTISVYTNLTMLSNNEQYIDTSIAEINTMKPVYRSSHNPNRILSLKYDKEITGSYLDKQTKKKNQVREPAKDAFFDSYIYPYLLGSLPLSSGYKANLPVYEYKSENTTNINTTRIAEVKSNIYESEITGEHRVWQVSVVEEATKEKYEYYIDKESRKILKIEIVTAGQQRFLLLNKEIDFNVVIKAPFNKEETQRLLTEGNAVITGVVFAKDNKNNMVLKGKSVFNINKKQFAQAGTSVILIPNTAYYKEWISVNEKLRKKGRPVPLSKDAAACIKVATVYDNEGHFEFTNLMPGDYILYTEFGYIKSTTHTEVVGYTDTYINGFFQGSTERTNTYEVGNAAKATVKKNITIAKDGETLSVKLAQTGSVF